MKPFETTLHELTTILNEITDKWFINGGGCLGYVRNGQLLAHDTDIDIGIFGATEEEINKINDRFPIIKKWYYKGRLAEVSFFLECQVDIFFLYPYEEMIAEMVFMESINRVRFFGYAPEVITGGIRKVLMNGVAVNVLNNSADYCRTLYGEDYMIEQKDWGCWASPPNIIGEEDIIPAEELNSIAPFTINGFERTRRACLGLIAGILTTETRQNFNPSLVSGCLGSVLFFNYYYHFINETVHKNWGDFLLLRTTPDMGMFDTSFLHGTTGLGFLLSHLEGNGFIEMEDEQGYESIDDSVVRMISGFNENVEWMELAGAYTYVLNRRRVDVRHGGHLLTRIKPGVELHTGWILGRISGEIGRSMSGNDKPTTGCSEELAVLLLLADRFVANGLIAHDQEIAALVTSFFELLLSNRLLARCKTIYACYIYTRRHDMLEDAFNKARKVLPEADMQDMQSYIRLCNLVGAEPAADQCFIDRLNDIFFPDGQLAVVPYRELGGMRSMALYEGLSGWGLLLASVCSHSEKLFSWDNMLLMS